jgi:hypothetical protein
MLLKMAQNGGGNLSETSWCEVAQLLTETKKAQIKVPTD